MGRKMIRIEHNVETGEIKEIELTTEEIKDIQERQELAAIRNAAAEAEAQVKTNAKAALLAKLGITEDEARLLLGGN
jgi:hypothetical protein